ncbi:MAG TPA: 30S ribosomal protein S6 [Chloroflexota bacterium]|nr:30S ribosomal protein S6 [Chloroflexota bacterium]
MNLYELTYILRPDLDEDALAATQSRIDTRLKDAGGEVVRSEAWGRRRLAYPIDHARDGLYFTSILRLPGPQLRGFEDQLKLTPEVLRFLVISQDEANIPKTGSLIPAAQPRPSRPHPPTEAATPTESSTPVEGQGAAPTSESPATPSQTESSAEAGSEPEDTAQPATTVEAEASATASEEAEPEAAPSETESMEAAPPKAGPETAAEPQEADTDAQADGLSGDPEVTAEKEEA